MRWRPILLLAVVICGCTSSEPAEQTTQPPATTIAATTTSTSVTVPPTSPTTLPPLLSEEEQAIVAARQAVRDEGVMGVEFANTARARTVDLGETIEVTLLPGDPDTIGATAVVVVAKSDMSVVEIRNYR